MKDSRIIRDVRNPSGFLLLAGFAFGGAVIPLLFSCFWWLNDRFGVVDIDMHLGIFRLMLILWPSSIMMMAPGEFSSWSDALVLLIEIDFNIALYVTVGAAIWYGLTKHYAVLVLVAIAIAVMWWQMLTL